MNKNVKRKDVDCRTLISIEELLSQELLLAKKCSAYSNGIFDSELKNICYNTGKIHEENYKLLLSYFSS